MRRSEALEADVRLFYDRLTALLMQYQFRNRDRACIHGITVTQCYALRTLTRTSSLTIQGLARELALDKSTASRIVGHLERHGFLTTERHPHEHRARVLRLTAAGRQLHTQIARDIRAEYRDLLRNYPRRFRQDVCRLLAALAIRARPRVRTMDRVR